MPDPQSAPYSMVKATAATIAASTFFVRPGFFLSSRWCVMIKGRLDVTARWFEDEGLAEDCKLRLNTYAVLASLGPKSGKSTEAKLLASAAVAMSHLLSALEKGEPTQVIQGHIEAVSEADAKFVTCTTGGR